jgi:hypothetical protein
MGVGEGGVMGSVRKMGFIGCLWLGGLGELIVYFVWGGGCWVRLLMMG